MIFLIFVLLLMLFEQVMETRIEMVQVLIINGRVVPMEVVGSGPSLWEVGQLAKISAAWEQSNVLVRPPRYAVMEMVTVVRNGLIQDKHLVVTSLFLPIMMAITKTT